MRNGSSTHFVLSAGYEGGGGSSGGFNRSRNDHRGDDERGSGGYSRGRNDHQSNSDDRGSGGYSRGRSDHQDRNDDHGGGGGYNRSRNDHYSNNGGGGGGGGGGDDNRMETQRDTIFIQNLPRSVTADELKDVFSQIGVIKVNCRALRSTNSYPSLLLE